MTKNDTAWCFRSGVPVLIGIITITNVFLVSILYYMVQRQNFRKFILETKPIFLDTYKHYI